MQPILLKDLRKIKNVIFSWSYYYVEVYLLYMAKRLLVHWV